MIKNNGKAGGKEVGQIYIHASHAKLDKPDQELKAFVKTEELKSGQSSNFTLSIPYHDLASYNSATSAWELEAGDYELRLGNSSQNISQRAIFTIAQDLTILKTGNLMKPDVKFNEIKP